MIVVDNREGSAPLLPLFPPGSARLDRLEFGDFAFTGRGPGGATWAIGVERKTLGEMLESLRGASRFVGHQLPGLLASYQRRYLIVEGAYRQNGEGVLETADPVNKPGSEWETGPYRMATAYTRKRKPFHARELAHHLQTIEERGMTVRHTTSKARTVECVYDLYTWWTCKEYDEHRSAARTYIAPASNLLVPQTWLWRMVVDGPGLGEKAAEALTAKFGSIYKLANASEDEIANATYKQEVNGDASGEGGARKWKERRVGDVAGKRVYRELREE